MKKVKKHHPITRREMIFNIVSLVLVIGIGIYFGARSFYYYSKQNIKLKEEEKTLVGYVLSNNKVTKEGDGLHQDTDGYYFQGMVQNNYVKFANQLFQMIRIHNNDTVQLVSTDLVSEFMWGEDSSYQSSNLYLWLTKTEAVNSGVYYNTIPNVSQFLTKTKYSEDILKDDKISPSKESMKDYITTLSLQDYVNAKGKNSFLNISKYFWLLGHDSDQANLYVDDSGTIQSGTSYDGYGVRSVITLKKGVQITEGDGTLTNPYQVSQGKDINYINQYVRLGNDVYQVYEDQNNFLRLSLNGYLLVNGAEYSSSYGSTNSSYLATNRKQLAYYLNHTYYNQLTYKNILADCNLFTGEISNETGYQYLSMYSGRVSNKIGLLNLFDYHSNPNLTDYYFMNTTSSVGSIAYVYHSLGLLGEAKVTDKKHIVPTVCISKTVLNDGKGTLENPYIVR